MCLTATTCYCLLLPATACYCLASTRLSCEPCPPSPPRRCCQADPESDPLRVITEQEWQLLLDLYSSSATANPPPQLLPPLQQGCAEAASPAALLQPAAPPQLPPPPPSPQAWAGISARLQLQPVATATVLQPGALQPGGAEGVAAAAAVAAGTSGQQQAVATAAVQPERAGPSTRGGGSRRGATTAEAGGGAGASGRVGYRDSVDLTMSAGRDSSGQQVELQPVLAVTPGVCQLYVATQQVGGKAAAGGAWGGAMV